jgi:acyl-CoA thioester hydrolase
MDKKYECYLTVRDYECDLQGVVNNAVYLNYLEHARHEWLKQQNLDFESLNKQDNFLIVIRSELDYLAPLCPGDSFRILSRIERISRLRFVFYQEIIRERDNKQVLNAVVTVSGRNAAGRPSLPAEILALFD